MGREGSWSEAYERLSLTHDLAMAIKESATVDEALAATLRLFCQAGGWAFGQVWLPDDTGQTLTCGPVWFAQEPRLEDFREASQRIRFRAGEPLLGLVWQDGRTRWADSSGLHSASFRRAEPARRAALRASLVVPIGGPSGVMAVMEFLAREDVPERAGVRQLIDAAAAQLGSLMSQKAAEAELRSSDARLRAVAETASDAIVSIDAAGQIVWVNGGTERLFDYTRSELIGASISVLIPKSLPETQREIWRGYLQRGTSGLIGKTVLTQGRHRDGHELPIEVSVGTWQEDGDSYFTVIMRDVSARQRMQEELQQALVDEQDSAAKLAELDRLKDTLLDAVSHDLRSPLAALKASISVMERDLSSHFLTEEQRRSYLQNMNAMVGRMRALVDDLLDLERLEAGEAPLQLAATDLGELVGRVVEEHRGALGSRPIELDLPRVVAEVDAAKAQRIVENLILNACRHTPMDASVQVSVQLQGANVLLCVDDAGPGVPAEMRTKVFERFSKSPGSSGGGVGIGLSLVDRFARLHGGRAWVEERPGGGAAFRVAIPREASVHNAEEPGR